MLAQVGDEYLDMEQRYKLVTKAYLGKGKDGYDSLAKAEVNFHQSRPTNYSSNIQVMVDEEIAPNLTSAVQNHFQAIKMKQGKVFVFPCLLLKTKTAKNPLENRFCFSARPGGKLRSTTSLW